MPSRACRISFWFWMFGFTACSVTNPLRRGGPPCPPAPVGFTFGFGCLASRCDRLQILCVGVDRCVRPRLSDFPLVLAVWLHGVFGSKSSA